MPKNHNSFHPLKNRRGKVIAGVGSVLAGAVLAVGPMSNHDKPSQPKDTALIPTPDETWKETKNSLTGLVSAASARIGDPNASFTSSHNKSVGFDTGKLTFETSDGRKVTISGSISGKGKQPQFNGHLIKLDVEDNDGRLTKLSFMDGNSTFETQPTVVSETRDGDTVTGVTLDRYETSAFGRDSLTFEDSRRAVEALPHQIENATKTISQ